MTEIPWAPKIPRGWRQARLKDHVDLTNGVAFDSERFSPSVGTPVVRIRDLLAGTTETYYDGPVPDEALIDNGDLLIGMDGDFNTAVWNGGKAALNQRVCRLRAKPSLNQRFLRYLVPLPLRHINDVVYYTTVKHLSSVELLNERISIPAVNMQERIADILDHETARLDGLIDARRIVRDRLIERRASAINLGVRGLLTPRATAHDAGLKWAPTVRKSWHRVKIKYAAALGTGHTPSRSVPEFWEDCTIPWITTGEIFQIRDDRAEIIHETREKISKLGLANSAADLHPAGTVVLCRTASAGYSAIMGFDGATSQDFVTWTCSDRLLPRYLLMCLRAMRQDLLGRLAYGSTHRTIYFPDVEALEIPLPPIDEQREALDQIDRHLQPIDALMDRISTQINLLIERRQSLITAAVTGDLQVEGAG